MGLNEDVLELLLEDGVEDETADLALAALLGPVELGKALGGEPVERPERSEASSDDEVPGAYLSSIEVAGFRGVGEPVSLDFTPGPGLHVVVGRNGSGKSSFAEGLEVLLTGNSWRWKDKSLVWKERAGATFIRMRTAEWRPPSRWRVDLNRHGSHANGASRMTMSPTSKPSYNRTVSRRPTWTGTPGPRRWRSTALCSPIRNCPVSRIDHRSCTTPSTPSSVSMT